MAVRPYDHTRDDLNPIEEHVDLTDPDTLAAEYDAGMRKYCSHLSVALELILANPSEATLTLGRKVVDEFQAWFERIQAAVATAENKGETRDGRD